VPLAPQQTKPQRAQTHSASPSAMSAGTVRVDASARDTVPVVGVDMTCSRQPANLAVVLRSALMQGRKLDFGNPSPSNLGADFGRLGMAFWDEVRALDARNDDRKDRLEELNEWRNAIAHQDFARVGGRALLHLGSVRGWRAACDALAISFDRAVGMHLGRLVGRAPW
jgi:hypothetical protein